MLRRSTFQEKKFSGKVQKTGEPTTNEGSTSATHQTDQHQANIWNQALNPDPDLPSPANWGWQNNSTGWLLCGPHFQRGHILAMN